MPGPFEALLLGLGAWRIWHLLSEDLILDQPRRYITKRWPALEDFIECPFCLGFWVALAWVGFYALWGEGAVWAALPLALNGVVVIVNHWLTSD